MITVYILASRKEESIVSSFWMHFAMTRRQKGDIVWTEPLYVEDLVSSNNIIPSIPQPYVIVGCVSPSFLSNVLNQPAVREMIEQADRRIPFVLKNCTWNEYPSPFENKMELLPHVVIANVVKGRRDKHLNDALLRLKSSLG